MKKLLTISVAVILVLSCFALSACQSAPGPDKPDNPDSPSLALKSETNTAEIDIYQTTYAAIDLPSLLSGDLSGVVYEASASSEHITLGKVSQSGKLNVISDGVTGDYKVTVSVQKSGAVLLSFDIAVTVKDGAPVPTVIKQIPTLKLDAPVFPHAEKGVTYIEYAMDMTEYFDAASNVTYIVECADGTVSATADEAKPYLLTLVFTESGTKTVTIHAVQNGEKKAKTEFTAELTEAAPNQLINGGFESGITGWNLDQWAKDAYEVYDSNVDIWGNGIDNDGKYLYGYKDEKGTCEFTSSLFTLSGSGVITFKAAGNGSPELKFVLMKYVENGDDVEIATFNNWYYSVYAQSGFIFRQYYYKVDSAHVGSKLYFKVVDSLSEEFAFVNLDSIVTYYPVAPNVDGMYKAGFCSDPSGVVLDMSDTSANPFPTNLSSVGYQLANGDFEQGYDGWYMTTAEKQAYAIYGSKTDIWNNRVNATGNYLYGYANESFSTAKFHSSLFKVGGTGLITWKMAGNSTPDLKLTLMKYNENGEDEVVAVFNNWFFPISQESGFIFRNYSYQLDMSKYEGSYCYFVVEDYRNSDFGFICLDDMVTYYETAPTLTGTWYKAGFCTNPEA